MEIQYADGGISVVFSDTNDNVSMGNMVAHPIISVKEARKLLGKELSGTIDEIDLMGAIGLMSRLAEDLLDTVIVPQDTMAGV